MNIMIAYWIFCIALVVAIMVMTATLVAVVTTTVERIQRIRRGHATS